MYRNLSLGKRLKHFRKLNAVNSLITKYIHILFCKLKSTNIEKMTIFKYSKIFHAMPRNEDKPKFILESVNEYSI